MIYGQNFKPLWFKHYLLAHIEDGVSRGVAQNRTRDVYCNMITQHWHYISLITTHLEYLNPNIPYMYKGEFTRFRYSSYIHKCL